MLAPRPPAPPEAAVGRTVRSALAAERRELAGRARGRVLDLGGFAANPYGPAVEEVVAVEPTGGGPGPAEAGASPARGLLGVGGPPRRVVSCIDDLQQLDGAPPFDSVVGVLHLATLAGADAALGRLRLLRRLIAPDGRLLLFEPLRRPGWRSWAVDVAVALRPRRVRARHRRGGLCAAHPVPDLARRAGFTPTSVERITMPTPLPPLRWCVRLVAVPGDDAAAPAPPAAPPAPPPAAAPAPPAARP